MSNGSGSAGFSHQLNRHLASGHGSAGGSSSITSMQRQQRSQFHDDSFDDSRDGAAADDDDEHPHPAPASTHGRAQSFSAQFRAAQLDHSDQEHSGDEGAGRFEDRERYDDDDDAAYDPAYDEHHPLEHSSGPTSSFQTSFPLPSLARTHPLSPLRESSQELDSARVRFADEDGEGDTMEEPLPSGEHEGFQTAFFHASPVAPTTGAAASAARPSAGGMRKSVEELDEFARLEAQALREAEEEAEGHSASSHPRQLRPSRAQVNTSLTRQEMEAIAREQEWEASRPAGRADRPPARVEQEESVFDDDEEWTSETHQQESHAAAVPSRAAQAQGRANPSAARAQPARSAPQHYSSHHAADESDSPSRDYARDDRDDDDDGRTDRRDPLSVAQVIPSSTAVSQFANPRAAQVQREREQQGTAPPTSSVVKKFFNSDPAPKKPAARPSTAPKPGTASGSRVSLAAQANNPKSGSNKKKDAVSLVSAGSAALNQERLAREVSKAKALAKEQEQELAFLRQEKLASQERLQAERDEFEKQRDEEVKRLKAQRVQLEKDRRALSGAPDRRERDAADELRAQLKQLSEELHLSQEKARAAEARARREKDALQQELRELKKALADAESRRLDEWEEREKAFHTQMDAQKRREAAESKKDRERRDGRLAQEQQAAQQQQPQQPQRPSTAAPAFPVVPSSAQSALSQTARSAAAAPHAPQNGVAAQSQQQQQHHHHHASHPSQPAPAAAVASSPAFPAFSSRPPTSSRGLINRGPAAHTLSVLRESIHPGGKLERFLSDNSRLILFKNGTSKRIFSDGFVVVCFPNGDQKQTELDGRVIYFYAAADTTHTTYPDGLQLYEFSNSQIERHYPDGRKQIWFLDGTLKNIAADGAEETRFADGTVQKGHAATAQHGQAQSYSQQQPQHAHAWA